MAKTPSLGEKIPLAVVEGDDIKTAENNERNADSMARDNNSISDDVARQISSLRDQIEQLKASIAEMGGKAAEIGGRAGRAVADGAGSATARVSSTIETYPLSTVFAASAIAFFAGRLSARPTSHESTTEQLWHRLQDLSSRIQPFIAEAKAEARRHGLR